MPDHPFQSGVWLDPSWPGLRPGGREVTVDPDLLARVGRLLVGAAGGRSADRSYLPLGLGYLDAAHGSTTVELASATGLPEGAHWFGRWPTAVLMEHSLASAGSAVVSYYRWLLEQVAAAGFLFTATGEDYRRQDEVAAAGLAGRGAGWDQPGVSPATSAGRAAGVLRESSRVPFIAEFEDVSDYDPQWIIEQMGLLRDARPWLRLHAAGDAFAAAAESLSELAGTIRVRAGQLAVEWDSAASVACQGALQRITGTAEHLAESCLGLAGYCHRSAEALQEAVSAFPTEVEGRSLGEWFRDTVTIGDNPAQVGKANEVRDALARLNDIYRTINYTTLPGEIAVNLPLLPAPGKERLAPGPHVPPSVPQIVPPPRLPAPLADPASAAPVVVSLPIGTGITGFPGLDEAGSSHGGEPGVGQAGRPVGGGLAGAAGNLPPGPAPGASTGPVATGPAVSPAAVGPSGAGAAGSGPVGGWGLPGAGGVIPANTPVGGRTGVGGAAAGQGGHSGRVVRASTSTVLPIHDATSGRPAAQAASRTNRRPGAGASGGARDSGTRQTAGSAGNMTPINGSSACIKDLRDSRRGWLVEDEDLWQVDDGAPPPVIR